MDKIVEIIRLLENTSSSKKKIEILKNNKDNELLQKVLKYTYSNAYNFGFSEGKLRSLLNKYETQFILTYKDGFSMLDTLSGSNINDNLRNQVLEFLSIQPTEELRELWFRILVKDLGCGISNKTIEKVWGDLLPKWEVMRPSPIDGVNIKNGTEFSLSLKENGFRATYRDRAIKSRQNEEFLGLEHIKRDIDKLKSLLPEFKNYVFDGELVRDNTDGVDDNKNLMLTNSILSEDESDKTSIIFKLFDMLPIDDFDNGCSKDTYFKRKSNLAKVEQVIERCRLDSLGVVTFLYQGKDQSQIEKWLEYWDNAGYEGLVLNLDKPYVCKKTKYSLKVKKFKFADVKILGWFKGKSGSNLGKFGGLIVDYKGTQTNITIGKQEDKDFFSENIDNLIGRVIEIKFKDETVNSKTGKVNIQFGNYVRLREEGKEVSYE